MTAKDRATQSWWASDGGDIWTRTVLVREGEPDLLLRVFPSPESAAPGEAWSWEIVEAPDDQEDAEPEIDGGAAESLELAMAVAVSEALAHIAGLADE